MLQALGRPALMWVPVIVAEAVNESLVITDSGAEAEPILNVGGLVNPPGRTQGRQSEHSVRSLLVPHEQCQMNLAATLPSGSNLQVQSCGPEASQVRYKSIELVESFKAFLIHHLLNTCSISQDS